MSSSRQQLKIFTGNANSLLAKEISRELGVPLGSATVRHFSDGEIQVNINESVRGADVFIIQPTCSPVNENLMELLVMIDAIRRASARRITAVMPYFGYARQDRKSKARDPISAKLLANLIAASGAKRVITMDLHANQIQGFFDIPVDHLPGVPILAQHFIQEQLKDVVVVSPDLGSVQRARQFAERISAPLAIIDRRRTEAHDIGINNIIGDIKNKQVIMIDDIIDTAETIFLGSVALKKLGAQSIYACCTHPVLSGTAVERLAEAPINGLVVTNTIPLPENINIDNLKILSVASLIGGAISKINKNLSVSELFV